MRGEGVKLGFRLWAQVYYQLQQHRIATRRAATQLSQEVAEARLRAEQLQHVNTGLQASVPLLTLAFSYLVVTKLMASLSPKRAIALIGEG